MQNLTEERIGQLIRQLQLKAGWTQKKLGMKIGISDKVILDLSETQMADSCRINADPGYLGQS